MEFKCPWCEMNIQEGEEYYSAFESDAFVRLHLPCADELLGKRKERKHNES